MAQPCLRLESLPWLGLIVPDLGITISALLPIKWKASSVSCWLHAWRCHLPPWEASFGESEQLDSTSNAQVNKPHSNAVTSPEGSGETSTVLMSSAALSRVLRVHPRGIAQVPFFVLPSFGGVGLFFGVNVLNRQFGVSSLATGTAAITTTSKYCKASRCCLVTVSQRARVEAASRPTPPSCDTFAIRTGISGAIALLWLPQNSTRVVPLQGCPLLWGHGLPRRAL